MPNSSLVRLSGDASSSHAVILVGGIHDTYEYFNDWAASAGGPDSQVLGFDHNHQSSTMAEGASMLAEAIRQLHEQGVEDVQVVAHSMGGLVSKAALNELAETGEAQEYGSIELHALGTPWGGFALADLPGTSTFGPMVGYPMAGEMSPGSDFLRELSQPEWPSNMGFTVYQGTADNVSLPSVLATHERYDENVAQARAIVSMEGFDHSDYVLADPSVLDTVRNHEALLAPLEEPFEEQLGSAPSAGDEPSFVSTEDAQQEASQREQAELDMDM